MRSPARDQARGQALTEFALVLPLLLMLVFGVFEFGRFILDYESLNNAVREGVRYAIVHGSDATCPSGPPALNSYNCELDKYGVNYVVGQDTMNAVKQHAFGLDLSQLSVTACWGNNCPTQGPTNVRGTLVTISATYTWRPLVSFLFLPSIAIQGTSTDVVNY